MLKQAAIVFGIVLLAIGVLGLVPAATPDGNLLGIFAVNGIHNVIHLLSGIIALWAGMASIKAAKMYFQVFGVIYALIAILGFVFTPVSGMLLGLVSINMADNWLHVIIALVALYFGFAKSEQSAM